jgi:hypothetical protein
MNKKGSKMLNWLFKRKSVEVEVKPVFEKVVNNDRYRTANPYYYRVLDGETNYLFTEKDLESAKKRALKNVEDTQ